MLITRAPVRAQGMVNALAARGIQTLVAATTCIAAVEGEARAALGRALLSASDFDWILLTSANAVLACEQILRDAGHEASVLQSLQIAVMGQGSADALGEWGLSAAVQANSGTSADLARLVLAKATQARPRVLFPRALEGRDDAVAVLEAAGAQVDLQVAYSSKPVETTDPDWQHALTEVRQGRVQGIAFFAPSQVSAFFELNPDARKHLSGLQVLAAIGSTTASAISALGLRANAVADHPTPGDLADKILQAFS